MYYYGFSRATKQCQFRADGPVEKIEGVVIIPSEECHEIGDITLVINPASGVAIGKVYKTAEQSVADLIKTREELYEVATNRLSILCEVIRRSTVKEAVERAQAEYEAWQNYRVALYELDLSELENVKWPPQPKAQ